MTKQLHDESIAASIAALRNVLAEIDAAQENNDPLLVMQLAESIEDHRAAILWSATVNARQVPGTSWTVIGNRLGITRQAAQQRFAGAAN
jgi:hypothetical protein